jgi:ubiquinone/menaquinone biosynthesis C-methylase UbiE
MELPTKPKHLNNLEFIRILTPYIFSSPLVAGRSVLDVGCGSGHGTCLLAMKGAEKVVVLDLDQSKIRQFSELRINLKNLTKFAMDAQKLGFKDHSYEIVTCFEVIEHVPEPDMLVSELRRVLKEDGVLILTTPNRAVRLRPLKRPRNPEHLREYTLKAFQRKFERRFPLFELLGIYGETKPHEYYRRMWKQSLLHAYFSWALPGTLALAPSSLKKWVRYHLYGDKPDVLLRSDEDLLNTTVPPPDPKNWPFYISDAKDDCLNILAICGFNDRVFQTAVEEIKQSAHKLYQP